MRSTRPRAHVAPGYEAAALRHDDEKRGLAKISAFAAHIGAGEQQNSGAFGGEVDVVGNEAAFGVLLHTALDDGVPSGCGFERQFQALDHLTKTLDPTRPVVGNDGWESVATDIIGIHDYDDQLQRIAEPVRGGTALPRLFRSERPGGRMLVVGEEPPPRPADRAHRVRRHRLLAGRRGPGATPAWSPDRWPSGTPSCSAVVRPQPCWPGFCYTQFADTYQEANGLLFADRTPKLRLE